MKKMWVVALLEVESRCLSALDFESSVSTISTIGRYKSWRIPNPTSNSVTDRSPFPINPTIFNVDALIGSLF